MCYYLMFMLSYLTFCYIFLFVRMPISDEKLVDAFYGLIALGALVTIKYIYPGLKKFLIKKFGHADETNKLDPEFVTQLANSMSEILKLADKNAKPAAVDSSSV